jgi:hypothetical protein
LVEYVSSAHRQPLLLPALGLALLGVLNFSFILLYICVKIDIMKPKQYAYKLLYEYSRILDKKSTDVQVIQCAMFYIQESISFVNIEDPLVNYYLEVKNYLLKKHHSASCNRQEL